jgi:hypothetical protein
MGPLSSAMNEKLLISQVLSIDIYHILATGICIAS